MISRLAWMVVIAGWVIALPWYTLAMMIFTKPNQHKRGNMGDGFVGVISIISAVIQVVLVCGGMMFYAVVAGPTGS